MATFTAVEQRAYIKIEYYIDTKRVKILNTLKSVCGKDALPKTAINVSFSLKKKSSFLGVDVLLSRSSGLNLFFHDAKAMVFQVVLIFLSSENHCLDI